MKTFDGNSLFTELHLSFLFIYIYIYIDGPVPKIFQIFILSYALIK